MGPEAAEDIMWRDRFALLIALCTVAFFLGCDGSDDHSSIAPGDARPVYTEDREPCTNFNPLRNLYFGDLHIHTALSHETWTLDVRAQPVDAYRFARGETIRLPPLDANGVGTRTHQLRRPLDFAAVTDHAEFLAEVEACVTEGSAVYNSLPCLIYRLGGLMSEIVMALPTFLWNPQHSPLFCGPGGVDCQALAESVWQGIRQAAEDTYDRTSTCSFSAFIAYEWTGIPGASNIHRNVMFRNANVPNLPASYIEEPSPQGLWAELKRSCLDSSERCDVIGIPHNSNESNGNKFFPRYPGADSIEEEREQALQRARMEPLVEIVQNKGESECMNGLSGVYGLPDELCDFEKIRKPPFEDCGDGTGYWGQLGLGCVSRLDYVRNVLLEGLREEERLGVNPYKLGIVAGTDTHSATPGAVAEDRYVGHRGIKETTPEERLGPGGLHPHGVVANPGGLTAVWAVENSRDGIFEALRRRETYATSGPRITVRFFGGWDLPEAMCDDRYSPDFATTAYQKGVPMGGDLAPQPAGSGAPRFVVLAMKDPLGPGSSQATPLQRIQIIKGWINAEKQPMHKVFEIAGDPNNGADVNLQTCERTGTGFDSLCTVWTDPEFHPAERAFYYARVVENPSCRWNTYECIRLPEGERPESCSDPDVDKVIQERAWTSPIWYTPPTDKNAAAKR
jgi:hypothetical protein